MVRVVALLLREYRGTPARGVGCGAIVSAWTWLPCFLWKRACAVLSCESVEALAVKFGCCGVGVARRRRRALRQRAGDVCDARAAAARCRAATLQRGVALAVYAAARGARCQKTGAVVSWRVLVGAREVRLFAGTDSSSMRRSIRGCESGEEAKAEARCFRPNATHASERASLRVAGVLCRFIASLLGPRGP